MGRGCDADAFHLVGFIDEEGDRMNDVVQVNAGGLSFGSLDR